MQRTLEHAIGGDFQRHESGLRHARHGLRRAAQDDPFAAIVAQHTHRLTRKEPVPEAATQAMRPVVCHRAPYRPQIEAKKTQLIGLSGHEDENWNGAKPGILTNRLGAP